MIWDNNAFGCISYFNTWWNFRQHSGRPPAGIIVDNEKAPEDDDMFINEETEELPMAMARSAAPVADDGQHGGLVQKILETQKNYATEDEQKNLKVS